MDFKKREQLLNESFDRMFQALLEDIESFKRNYTDIEDDIFYKLLNIDPTYKGGDNRGTYAAWIMSLYRQIKKQGETYLNRFMKEDLYKVTEYLTKFEEKKKFMSNKDINKYKTLPELSQALNEFESKLSDRQELRRRQKAVTNADLGMESELVYEDENWEVWIPKTKAASCRLGSGTKWCTATKSNNNMFDGYSQEGKLYININKQHPEEKYQFHFESNQFMDKNDYPIDLVEFLKEFEDLRNFYTNIIAERFLNNNIDKESIVIKFDYPDMTTYLKYTENKFGSDFIKACLRGDLFSYFEYYDSSLSLYYIIDDISDENKDVIKDLGCNIDTIDEDTLKSEFEDIHYCILRAYEVGKIIGAESECLEDFNKALKNASPNFILNISNDGTHLHFVVDIKRFKEEIFDVIEQMNELNEEFSYDLKSAVGLCLATEFSFNEPYYGWDGFEVEYFNDRLSDELSEISRKDNINEI